MTIAAKLGLGAVVLAALALGGCGPLEQIGRYQPVGFVAAPAHIPRARRIAFPVSAAQAQDVAPADTALSKCRRALYLKSASSQDDMHFLEARCRAVILSQPY